MQEKISLPVITLIKGGPIKISGNYSISDDTNNNIVEGKEVYLCRCGNSANKPYCDGTHKANFPDERPKKESCE